MKQLADHEVQHLTFEEYKNAFKKNENPLLFKLTNKITKFLNETKFFMKFAFALIIFITLLALLTEF